MASTNKRCIIRGNPTLVGGALTTVTTRVGVVVVGNMVGDSVGNDAKLGRLVGTGVGIEVGFVVVGRVVGDLVVG